MGSPILPVKAFKIDGQGKVSLKAYIGLPLVSSCDYFKCKNNYAYFIEISDFELQFQSLKQNKQQLLETLKASGEKEKMYKHLIADVDKYIRDDIQKKLQSTCNIYDIMVNNYGINQRIKYALIVFCSDKIDIMAFEKLTGSLKNNLGSLFADIAIIPYIALEKKIA